MAYFPAGPPGGIVLGMPAVNVTINREAYDKLVQAALRDHRRVYQQASWMLEQLLLDGAATPESPAAPVRPAPRGPRR